MAYVSPNSAGFDDDGVLANFTRLDVWDAEPSLS